VQKPKITRGKSIGFSECPHRNILRRPFSNAGNFAQFVKECVGVNHSSKSNLAATHAASESANRFGPGARHADFSQVFVCHNFRRREQMRKSMRPAELRPKAAGHAASECSRAPDGNLLPENRAHREFETIPGARHSQPGIGLNAIR
jgi:hypothetical protein